MDNCVFTLSSTMHCTQNNLEIPQFIWLTTAFTSTVRLLMIWHILILLISHPSNTHTQMYAHINTQTNKELFRTPENSLSGYFSKLRKPILWQCWSPRSLSRSFVYKAANGNSNMHLAKVILDKTACSICISIADKQNSLSFTAFTVQVCVF